MYSINYGHFLSPAYHTATAEMLRKSPMRNSPGINYSCLATKIFILSLRTGKKEACKRYQEQFNIYSCKIVDFFWFSIADSLLSYYHTSKYHFQDFKSVRISKDFK